MWIRHSSFHYRFPSKSIFPVYNDTISKTLNSAIEPWSYICFHFIHSATHIFTHPLSSKFLRSAKYGTRLGKGTHKTALNFKGILVWLMASSELESGLHLSTTQSFFTNLTYRQFLHVGILGFFFRFTAKLSRRYRDFPYPSAPTRLPPEWYIA